MNSKDSKTSDPHRLLLNLSDKINLKKIWQELREKTNNPSIMIYAYNRK